MNVAKLMTNARDWVQAQIRRRRQAYRRVLGFGQAPTDDDRRVVLKDLARFCRAHRSTGVFSHIRGAFDPLASARADGRREVWLRIVEHLHLDEKHLVNLREHPDD